MSVLNHLTLGRYIPGNSLLYRLDPRVKLGVLAAIMGIVFTGLTISDQLGLILLLVLAGRVSKLPLRMLLSNFRPLIPILVLTLILNGLWIPGRVLFSISNFPVELTEEGLRRGGFLILRLSVLVIGTALLTLTTSPLELSDGLERLFRPAQKWGLPVHELALTLTIALRFIPVLVDEADRLYQAQVSRGADLSGNPIRRIRRLMPLLLPLFVSAFSRADRLATALEARCYQGQNVRTQFQPLKLKRLDYTAILGVFVLTVLMLIPTF